MLSDSWPLSESTDDVIVIFDFLFGPCRAASPAGAQDFGTSAQCLTAGVEEDLILASTRHENAFILSSVRSSFY